MLVLQEITERLQAQRSMAERAQRTAPQEAQVYSQRAQQLENEQQVLGTQLQELRRVRAQLETQVEQQFNLGSKPKPSAGSRNGHSRGATSKSTNVRSNTTLGFDHQQRQKDSRPSPGRGTTHLISGMPWFVIICTTVVSNKA